MIKLDINIGDYILVGRFKNKRIEVKEIGVDEHGGPTVNGRSILKIRIEKLMKTKKQIKESKQFKLANIAKKILKENSNEVDQLFKFLDHPWQEDGEIEFVSLLDQNRGNFKTSNWAATLRYLRSMDKANSNLSMMASDKFLTMWDDLIK